MFRKTLQVAALLAACFLAGAGALQPAAEVQGTGGAIEAALRALEELGSATAPFKAHDALWPAVQALVKPLLSPDGSRARRRLAAAGAAAPALPFPTVSEATSLVQQYGSKLLQLQALSAQQAFTNSVESMLGMVVNETAVRQTEAAIQRMQDVMGNVVLQSFNGSLARVQLASTLMSRARQRAAALNASASPLWSAGQGWQQSTQNLLAQLSGPLLPSLLGNLTALAGSTPSRRLQGQQQQQGTRKHALAGRFHHLRADRAAMRGRLRRARSRNSTAGDTPANMRRLQEAVAAAAEGAPAAAPSVLPVVQRFVADDDAWLYWNAAAVYQQGYADGVADTYARQSGQLWACPEGDEDAADAPLWSDANPSSDEDALLAMQDDSLAPASQLLWVDTVILLKDLYEEALGAATPLPNWASAYGYTPDRSIFYPADASDLGLHPAQLELDGLTIPVHGENIDTQPVQPPSAEPTDAPGRRRLSQQQPPLPAGDAPFLLTAVESDAYDAGYEYTDADLRRRQLRQADAAIFPPLPPGNPPALDEQLDASYYGEGEDEYSDDSDYYGSELDWLFEDEGDLLGLLLTLPTTRTADASSSPPSSTDAPTPALPVYAVFASSSRGPVVPSTANSSTAEEPAKAKPLELIVAPFGVGPKPPHPAQEHTAFDPRWFGLVASLAIIALVVGVLAVWSRSRRSSARSAVEQEEQLLYSHIPGTPKRGKAGSAASATTASGSAAWQPGKGGSPAGKAAGAPVPKKLSNLPA
ncbi:outer membrane efflux [Chlorella sorokiniana]|uniref:Outer membrane efflux n=1 Tax=Chlorella sorokiniana TaxID=3076 RepID=A0A2P6U5G0_CHLSO|nr:outer membrane efflux [Chlorella sorokiniana]|eukprot:PRW61512.1 outer membrane efflux [Chlorella sorokiniana]